MTEQTEYRTMGTGLPHAQAFIDAMSRAVSGVSVVTTDGSLGRFGLTVSSMVSVSANPPMLLVCINSKSAAHDAIRGNGTFTINVLGARHRDVAATFSGSSEFGEPYTFDQRHWALSGSAPRLRLAAACFECDLESALTFGSHSIIVGRVRHSLGGDETPLLYTGRSFGRPAFLN